MNSISFINILCAQKNTADVRTYTQKSNTLSSSPSFVDATTVSRNTRNSESDSLVTSWQHRGHYWTLFSVKSMKRNHQKSLKKMKVVAAAAVEKGTQQRIPKQQ
jgi:hypothetical protein